MQKLSKSGFHRIPRNALQRNFGAGGVKKSVEVLDAFNERQEDYTIHPTNGVRTLSVKRSRAQYLIGHIKQGGSADIAKMRHFLQHGY